MIITRQRLLVATLTAVFGAGVMLVARNPAPVVPFVPLDDPAVSAQPYVVKLHARWCPSCMSTKDAWSEVQNAYAGRVRLVVFDFTTGATTAASLAEARRLGLSALFDEYSGETGTVLVVDGRSGKVRTALNGTRAAKAYRSAIDAALAGTSN